MGGVVLVTGAASGIGRSLVGKLLADGWRVVATDVNETGLHAAAQSGGWTDPARVTLRPLDVRDPAAWREVIGEIIRRHGALDVLANVAGVLVPTWAHEATDRDVDFTVDVNVKGVVHGTNEALRHMVARGAGHVVNVASIPRASSPCRGSRSTARRSTRCARTQSRPARRCASTASSSRPSARRSWRRR